MSIIGRVRDWVAAHGGLEAFDDFRDCAHLADHLLTLRAFSDVKRSSLRRTVVEVQRELVEAQGDEDSCAASPEMSGTSAVEADAPDSSDRVHIDHDAKLYIFYFYEREDGQWIEHEWDASFREVSDWCWWYPHQGQGSTRRELCLLAYEHHGRTITERWMARALRVMGILKASPPLAPHELEKYKRPKEIERLIFQRRQARAQIAVHSSERRQLRRLVREKQEEMQDRDAALARVIDALKDVGTQAPKAKRFRLEQRDHIVITGVSDAHIGKRAGEYGLKESIARFERAAETMAHRIASYGAPEKIIVAFNGDYLHVDTHGGTTTRGTPQDVDASTAQILWNGIQAACMYVDTMRALAPVEVVIVPGNHDQVLTYAVAGALAMRYQDVDDVTCEFSEANRKYIAWHTCLIGFEHGDGPKPGKLATLMTHECRQEWAKAQHCYWIVGHLHHERVWDVDGVTFLQSPSLAPVDSWHDKKGYTLSRKSHTAYILDPDDGLIGTLHAPTT